MTLRSIFFGLLGAAFICSVVYFNDYILMQTYLIGNHMPIIVYGPLILFALAVTPIIIKMTRGGAYLTGKELTTIFFIMVVVCCIPASGFLRSFTIVLMFPHQYEQTEPGWKENRAIELTPEKMLADPAGLADFQKGLPKEQGHISLLDIPWDVWSESFGFWIPIVFSTWIACLGLAMMFHVQWARHEHLPYPLARFTHEILPPKGEKRNPMLNNKLFLAGLVGVFLIYTINFLKVHYPNMIEIKTEIDFTPMVQNISPTIKKSVVEFEKIFKFKIFFVSVGLAFFLSREVSFSVGISKMLYGAVSVVCILYGVDLRAGGDMAPIKFAPAGAYAATFLTILYTGRHFYQDTFKSALTFRPPKEAPGFAVWGARLFILSSFVTFMYMVSVGLDWQLAITYLLLLHITYVVLSRILAETGIVIIGASWKPMMLIMGLFGAQSLGPETVIILAMLGFFLPTNGGRESLMPYLTNAFKMLDHRGLEVPKVAKWTPLVLLMGLVVALGWCLFFQYDGGQANMNYNARTKHAPTAHRSMIEVSENLIAQGALEKSLEISGWERFSNMSLSGPAMTAFAISFAVTIALTVARLRFIRWPLHPVALVVGASWGLGYVAQSMLLGWLIKTITVKYGGEKGVAKVKPFMIGIICGELLAAFLGSVVQAAYYFITGDIPSRFTIYKSD